jgi:hypothetical protein
MEVAPVQQRNGQLMGSILSFPILCLANLGLYLAVVEKDPRPLAEKLRGVLVNGDDMLYVAPQSLWKEHVELGKSVGLTMSPGKAYHHPVYANANSACYHFDLNKFRYVERFEDTDLRKGRARPAGTSWWTVLPNSSTPRYIPFLNVGLFFGQNKVLGSQGDDGVDGLDEDEKSYVSVIDRITAGALPGRGNEILAQYLGRFKAEIRAECLGRNLFLPISLGGMGVTKPEGFKSRVTVAQRQVAQELVDEAPYGTLTPLPAERQHLEASLPDAPQPVAAPWLSGAPDDGGFEPEASRQLKPLRYAKRASQLLGHSRTQFEGGVAITASGREIRLAKDRDLWFELRLSPVKRSGTTYRAKHPKGGRFERAMARDIFRANVDLHCEEEENTICYGELSLEDLAQVKLLYRAFPNALYGTSYQSSGTTEQPCVRVYKFDAEEQDEVDEGGCLAQA